MLLSLIVFTSLLSECNTFQPFLSNKFTGTLNRVKVSTVEPEVQKVAGNEGLLDYTRMEKAFRGTGVKISPEKKLKVGIIGAGLAGMISAMELSEAGHEVEIYEARRFISINTIR